MDPSPEAWSRFIVAALMLAGASVWDLRERRVPNQFWFPYVAFAAVFAAVDIAQHQWVHLIGAAVVASLAYLFFRMGLWGGADAKGVMVLSFLVAGNLYGTTTVAVLDALVAGMTLTLLLPVGLTVWNLAHGRTAFPALLIGTVMPLERAWNRRVWPIEDAEGWRFRARIGEDLRRVYHGLEKQGRTEVWTTLQLPLMVFILAGFGLTNLFGSPLDWIAALAP